VNRASCSVSLMVAPLRCTWALLPLRTSHEQTTLNASFLARLEELLVNRTVSSRTAAIAAGFLLVGSVGATVLVSSGTASGAVVHTLAASTSSSITASFDTIKGELKGGPSAVTGVEFNVQKTCSDCRLTFSAITITKPVDIATPKLQQALALGTPLKIVTINFLHQSASGVSRIVTKYQLTNAFVTSDSIQSQPAGQVEHVTLTFDTYRILQLAAASNTTSQFAWSVVTNTPIQ